jgi:putative glutamine amidotransferase
MSRFPTVLISPNIEKKGDEFGDLSTSLSETYQRALMEAGAIPFALPATVSRKVISECVSRCDGVLLTGGEDIDPHIYANGMAESLRKLAVVTADGGARDYREMMLVDETFKQRKPLLAICRGHQVLNVALGGTLLADIRRQRPEALNHRRMDKRSQVVHEVRLTPDSLLAKIAATPKLGVNSTHHQAVDKIAPPLRPVAMSEDGIVEALELKPGALSSVPFLLSVQFHPERLVDRYKAHRAIFRAFSRSCGLCQKSKI